MQTREVLVDTGGSRRVVDLTSDCTAFLLDVAADADGLLHVFVPHATAGVALMELGSGSDADLLAALERMLPRDAPWTHRHGSPGHAVDHLVPALVSPSLTIPVLGGEMALGTWQSVALIDPNRDNPQRRVRLSFVPAG